MSELQKACQTVSEELKKHGDFYDAFVASVKSVLDEPADGSLTSEEFAKEIVNRIIGED